MTLTALPSLPLPHGQSNPPGAWLRCNCVFSTAGPPCNALHVLTQSILTAARLAGTNSYPPGTGPSGHTQWVRDWDSSQPSGPTHCSPRCAAETFLLKGQLTIPLPLSPISASESPGGAQQLGSWPALPFPSLLHFLGEFVLRT